MKDPVIFALAVIVPLVFVTVKKKALSLAGALAAAVMLVSAAFCGGWTAIVPLLFSYGVICAADAVFGKKSSAVSSDINMKCGRRDIVQVGANGLCSTLLAVAFAATGNDAFILAYFTVLAESLGDSLASDVGVLSKRPPIDILTLKPVRRGVSGAVSLLGSLCGIGGCAVMSLLSVCFFGLNFKYMFVILVASVLGVLADSILGASVQVGYSCTVCSKPTEKKIHCGVPTRQEKGISFVNNDVVNFASNIISGVIAVLMAMLLGVG